MTQPQIAPSFENGSFLPSDYVLGNVDLLSFSQLLELKQVLQKELFRLGQLLEQQGVNMNTSILTADGFPRADLDIVTIRHLRSRIYMLRNDFDSVMESLNQKMLHQFNSQDEADHSNVASLDTVFDDSPEEHNLPAQPFISVQDVLAQSPAFQAGLQVGDKIIQFHNLTYSNTLNITGNNAKLFQVADLVKAYQNRELVLKVLRYDSGAKQYSTVELRLVPHSNWNGLGLLGCKLVQI